MKEPRSGKISSLSLCWLKHSQRAIARVEKARGNPKGEKHFPLLGGGGGSRLANSAIEKPKPSPFRSDAGQDGASA